MMIAKKVYSQLKAVASPPSMLVSYFSSVRFQWPDNNSRVFVWWDVDNCGALEGVNISRVAQTIKAGVQANGMNGPIQIWAVTDVFKQPKGTLKTLHLADIKILHVPDGDEVDAHVIDNLFYWVERIPSPAHLILITDEMAVDMGLANCRLREDNILLLASDAAPDVCPYDVNIVWRWNDLMKGNYLSGLRNRQFPFNRKLTLEHPSLVAAEPSLPNSSMVDANSGAEKLTPVEQIIGTHEKEVQGVSQLIGDCEEIPNDMHCVGTDWMLHFGSVNTL